MIVNATKRVWSEDDLGTIAEWLEETIEEHESLIESMERSFLRPARQHPERYSAAQVARDELEVKERRIWAEWLKEQLQGLGHEALT